VPGNDFLRHTKNRIDMAWPDRVRAIPRYARRVIDTATKRIVDTNETPAVVIVVRKTGGFAYFMNIAPLDVRQCTTCMNSRFK